MQKKLLKKVVAGALSVVLVLGMTAVSFADTYTDDSNSRSDTGTGTFEGTVNEDVVSVDLPTDAGTHFDYIMDPEGLIKKTDAAAHGGDASKFGEGNVYFLQSDGTYKSTSEKLKVKNTGTVDVDVTMSAYMASDPTTKNYKMATSKNMTSTDAELYLGIVVEGIENATPITSVASGSPTKIERGVYGNAENYEVQAVSSGSEYVYQFKAKTGVADTAWNYIAFGLEGACNTTEGVDWSNVPEDGAVNVEITWEYAKRAEGSQQVTMMTTNAQTGPSISISETGLITASRIDDANNPVVWEEFVVSDGESSWAYTQYPELFTLTNTDNWENGVGGEFEIQLNEGAVNGLKGKTATITTELQDGTVLTDSVVIK